MCDRERQHRSVREDDGDRIPRRGPGRSICDWSRDETGVLRVARMGIDEDRIVPCAPEHGRGGRAGEAAPTMAMSVCRVPALLPSKDLTKVESALLVSRFRRSYPVPARARTNVGTGTLAIIWFQCGFGFDVPTKDS